MTYRLRLHSLWGHIEDAFEDVFGPHPAPAVMPGAVVALHPRGHAHNDEMHAHPLVDALNAGFTSIEADTHLIDGRLLVGHSPENARHIGLTLEQSYLAPLAERVKQYGAVYQGGPPVILLLDFKGEKNASGEQIYQALEPLLAKYPGVLSRFEDGQVVPGALQVVISGTEPKLAPQADRAVFLDGHVGDLLKDPAVFNSGLTPMVSGDYKQLMHWNGHGEMSATDQKQLASMVSTAHGQGVALRLWHAPDNPTTWQALENAGVDYINTDNLNGFAQWQDQHPVTSPLGAVPGSS